MDFRTQSTLLAAIMAVALAVAMLLRSERAKAFTLFAVLCLTLGAWYVGDFLFSLTGHAFWMRAAIESSRAAEGGTPTRRSWRRRACSRGPAAACAASDRLAAANRAVRIRWRRVCLDISTRNIGW